MGPHHAERRQYFGNVLNERYNLQIVPACQSSNSIFSSNSKYSANSEIKTCQSQHRGRRNIAGTQIDFRFLSKSQRTEVQVRGKTLSLGYILTAFLELSSIHIPIISNYIYFTPDLDKVDIINFTKVLNYIKYKLKYTFPFKFTMNRSARARENIVTLETDSKRG